MDKDLWDQRSLEGKSYDVAISVFVGWSKFVQILFKPISLSDFQDYENNFFAAQYLHKKIDIMSSQSLFVHYFPPQFLGDFCFCNFRLKKTNFKILLFRS